jgi:outer membrane protein TolC
MFQFNQFKWEKKIEPLRYEEAKWEYIYQLELISETAVNYFFDLALAQLNVEIAGANFHNNDTIYKIAKGRYDIGTIVENELLETELALLNAKAQLAQSKIDLEVRQFRLRSFLGYNDKVRIRLLIEKNVAFIEIPLEKAIAKSFENNSTLLSFERQLLEAARDVAQTRAENHFNANLFATFGLNQSAFQLEDAYIDPGKQQKVTVGLEIPIVDWGEGKGKYRMAQSNQEVVRTRVDQARSDFEQQVYLKVMQFNEQDNQLIIAAKADTIAQKRYEVSKQRFLIGKIDVLDLNVASTDKDLAMRNYISALKTYWAYYYNIRQFTLYDFLNDVPLDINFKELEY